MARCRPRFSRKRLAPFAVFVFLVVAAAFISWNSEGRNGAVRGSQVVSGECLLLFWQCTRCCYLVAVSWHEISVTDCTCVIGVVCVPVLEMCFTIATD